jgi:hypothetical protein
MRTNSLQYQFDNGKKNKKRSHHRLKVEEQKTDERLHRFLDFDASAVEYFPAFVGFV